MNMCDSMSTLLRTRPYLLQARGRGKHRCLRLVVNERVVPGLKSRQTGEVKPRWYVSQTYIRWHGCTFPRPGIVLMDSGEQLQLCVRALVRLCGKKGVEGGKKVLWIYMGRATALELPVATVLAEGQVARIQHAGAACQGRVGCGTETRQSREPRVRSAIDQCIMEGLCLTLHVTLHLHERLLLSTLLTTEGWAKVHPSFAFLFHLHESDEWCKEGPKAECLPEQPREVKV